jgi:hypothetical protein
MGYDINKLEKFLYNANKFGYAGGAKKVKAQRPGFDELEYREGDWLMHDSYCGHYFAPGQEVVYYKNKPVWAMAYTGGMLVEHHGDSRLTKKTISFLKKALLAMDSSSPYRGPENYCDGDFAYKSKITGDIKYFSGIEQIFYKDKLVFEQKFMGSIIV